MCLPHRRAGKTMAHHVDLVPGREVRAGAAGLASGRQAA